MNDELPVAIIAGRQPPRRLLIRAALWLLSLPARISDAIFGPTGPHDWMI